MSHDSWKTNPGPQYDPVGYVEFVSDDYYQHPCSLCEGKLAAFYVEGELDGKTVVSEYRCEECHAEVSN